MLAGQSCFALLVVAGRLRCMYWLARRANVCTCCAFLFLLVTSHIKLTHPPLKAPTGFLTGATTASCLSTELVWKLRVTTGALVAVRNAGRRIRDAIVAMPQLSWAEVDKMMRVVVLW
jgi:hypothetical protein